MALTEQWREGTLPDGWYYLDYDTQEVKVEIKDGRMYIGGIIVNRHSYGDDIDLMTIKGSVPSYDEIKRLQEQLKEAVNFIEELAEACDEEGILYPRKRKKLEEIEKWGIK